MKCPNRFPVPKTSLLEDLKFRAGESVRFHNIGYLIPAAFAHASLQVCSLRLSSVAKCRGSWVVGRGCESWVWVWVNVVGQKSTEKNDKKIIIINRKNL